MILPGVVQARACHMLPRRLFCEFCFLVSHQRPSGFSCDLGRRTRKKEACQALKDEFRALDHIIEPYGMHAALHS
eukprot:CAMPEP_0185305036 /NCGR_PEP_ID=MMETSP1363-20130426/15145_1 /TAXON_ID=38817 /ORGANISM="Gephyrocapsa oceanica, Strain RCC1303" /LENGTH=74 /DNA_ID=CAMNT_0027902263 /DNA_START=108 /DNA_END=332 /DNA_ORIENTATION=+